MIVNESTTAPERSFTTGFWPEHGAVAAISGGFVIHACDMYGNERTRGGDKMSVEIRGVAAKAIIVTDRNNGTYTVEYCIPVEGTYTVNATLLGHHVRGSPMSLSVYKYVTSTPPQPFLLPTPYPCALLDRDTSRCSNTMSHEPK